MFTSFLCFIYYQTLFWYPNKLESQMYCEIYLYLNQVALNQWLYHNMDTVVSMYEDRFDLCILESQPVDVTDSIQTEEQNWWKRLTQQNSKAMSPELHCIDISHFSMPVKRTKELRAVTGWYVFSSSLLLMFN